MFDYRSGAFPRCFPRPSFAKGTGMVDVRRKFDLYVALRKILQAELAAWLLWELQEIERTPSLDRRNHERFRDKPGPVLAL
jgi:hypothetical protein